MNSVIEWLFQRTSDGSMYLQLIVVGLLLIELINLSFKTFEIIREEVDEAKQKEIDDEI